MAGIIINILGIEFSILGLIGIGLGIFSMAILIWKQKMTWYIWSLWISIAAIWLIHYFIFQDAASMVDTTISLILYMGGLWAILSIKGKKKSKKNRS